MIIRKLLVVWTIATGFGSFVLCNQDIDSLLSVVKKSSKKEKAAIFNELSRLSIPIAPNNAYQYAQQAYDLAVEMKDQNEEADALVLIGTTNYVLNRYEDSKKAYNQALIIYNKLQDIERIANTFNNLGILHREMDDYITAEDYFQKSLDIFEDLDDIEGKAESINLLGSLYLRQHNYDKALEEYSQALALRKKLNNKLTLAASYNNLGLVYKELDNHSLALDYHEKSLNIFTELDDTRNLAATLNYIGNIYWKIGIYNKALEYYIQALELREEIGIQTDIAGSLSNIGLLYLDMNNLNMAEEYFSEALDIYDEIGNKKMLSITFNRIGNLFLKKYAYKKSLQSFQNAMQISIELEDKTSESNSLRNIGKVYTMMDNFDKALDNYNLAVINNETIENYAGNAYIYNDIGNLYKEQDKKQEALNFYNKAIDVSEKVDNKFITSLCSRKIGELYIEWKEYTKALPYIKSSLEIAEHLNHSTLIQNAYFAYYQYYINQNQITHALENYILYSNYKDSIHQELNNKRITELQIKNEIEQRENVIESLGDQIHNISQLNKKQEIIITYLIVISVLVTLLVFLFLSRSILKKRTNEMLRKQMQIIEETNAKLTDSEKNLRILNSTKDKFFSIIAHDLKNPIGAILGITELLTKDFENQSTDTLREYNELIHTSSKQLFELLQNLLQWARSQTGRIKYNPEVLNLGEMINENINLLKLSAKKKKIVIKSTIVDDKVLADKEMLNTVLRNLISNAVKFTNPGGKINVLSSSMNGHIQVLVEDSGVGMTKDELSKLFRLDVHHTTMGTLNEAGTGLGLILCKEFIEKNKGKITVESEPGKGSKFIFTIPLHN